MFKKFAHILLEYRTVAQEGILVTLSVGKYYVGPVSGRHTLSRHPCGRRQSLSATTVIKH